MIPKKITLLNIDSLLNMIYKDLFNNNRLPRKTKKRNKKIKKKLEVVAHKFAIHTINYIVSKRQEKAEKGYLT